MCFTSLDCDWRSLYVCQPTKEWRQRFRFEWAISLRRHLGCVRTCQINEPGGPRPVGSAAGSGMPAFSRSPAHARPLSVSLQLALTASGKVG
ncbi:MAG: hypothetical protein JWM76_2375 [Pseudonocardiales bacterium]|nr:hypothetical protein [Pseudonocardiales bacterium]